MGTSPRNIRPTLRRPTRRPSSEGRGDTVAKGFRSTIDVLIKKHYPQLKERVHVELVSCGAELSGTVNRLSSISPNFGLLHPSLALFVAADPVHYYEVSGPLSSLQVLIFRLSNAQSVGQTTLFPSSPPPSRLSMGTSLWWGTPWGASSSTRPSSTRSSMAFLATTCPVFPRRTRRTWAPLATRDNAFQGTHSCHEFRVEADLNGTSAHRVPPRSPRQHSAPPSAGHIKKKISFGAMSVDSLSMPSSRLVFQPSAAFLLGCPLGLVLAQRKLSEQGTVPLWPQLNLFQKSSH